MSDDFEDLEVSEDLFRNRRKERRDRRNGDVDDGGGSDDDFDRRDRKLDRTDARTDFNNSKAAKRKWLVFLILSLMGSLILLKVMLGF